MSPHTPPAPVSLCHPPLCTIHCLPLSRLGVGASASPNTMPKCVQTSVGCDLLCWRVHVLLHRLGLGASTCNNGLYTCRLVYYATNRIGLRTRGGGRARSLYATPPSPPPPPGF